MRNDARTHLEIRPATDTVWHNRLMPALVIFLLITTVIAYYFGKYRAEVEWQSAVNALVLLEKDYLNAVRDNTNLKESLELEIAKNSRDSQIKRLAYDEIAQTLAATSNEVADLKDDIRFYESIVEGDENKKGLQIKSLSLQADGTTGSYRYKVVIINSDYGNKKSKGTLSIELEGEREGKLEKVKIPAAEDSEEVTLLFKYLQRIDGVIAVPDNFQPQRVGIMARLSGKKAVKIEKWYNWIASLNQDGSRPERVDVR